MCSALTTSLHLHSLSRELEAENHNGCVNFQTQPLTFLSIAFISVFKNFNLKQNLGQYLKIQI